MTDKKVLWIRIFIAITTFVILFSILLEIFLKTARESAYRWHPNSIDIVLFILAFIMLANGVSYLSEILKKNKRYLKILTGILSVMIFVFTLSPQDRDANPIILWVIFIGLSSSSILISVFSVLEWAQIKIKLRWLLSFLFALNSGIYSWLITAMILRGYNFSEAGLVWVGFGAILFLICMIVNLIAVLSLKNKIRAFQGV